MLPPVDGELEDMAVKMWNKRADEKVEQLSLFGKSVNISEGRANEQIP